MRSTWTNDKLNLFKIVALDTIRRENLRCGAIWYVTEPPIDKGLHDSLSSAGQKTLEAVSNTIEDFIAAFTDNGLVCAEHSFAAPVPIYRQDRKDWFEQAQRAVDGCEAVFLDPNTGIRYGAKSPTTDYATLSEIYALSQSKHVLIYQHSPQMISNLNKQVSSIVQALECMTIARDRITIKQHNETKRAYLVAIRHLSHRWPARFLCDWDTLCSP